MSVATPVVPTPRATVHKAPPPVPTPRLRDVEPGDQTIVQALAQAQQIFISLEGDEATAQALRAQLHERLQATQRWTVASREEADTALQVTMRTGTPTIIAQVVNADGRVLWPRTGRARVYRGAPEQVAAQLVADMLAAARSQRR